MNTKQAVRVKLALEGRQQKWLAEKLGVSESSLSTSLKSNVFNGPFLASVAAAFDMKLSELIALGEQQ